MGSGPFRIEIWRYRDYEARKIEGYEETMNEGNERTKGILSRVPRVTIIHSRRGNTYFHFLFSSRALSRDPLGFFVL